MKKWQTVSLLVLQAAKSKKLSPVSYFSVPEKSPLKWSWLIHSELKYNMPWMVPKKVWMELSALLDKIMGWEPHTNRDFQEWMQDIPDDAPFKVYNSGNVYLIDYLDGTGALCVDGDTWRDAAHEFQIQDKGVYSAFGKTIYLPSQSDLEDAIHCVSVKISQ